MKTAEIIKNLRTDNDKTQDEMAKILKIDRKTYNRYEKGLHEIKLDVLINLAKYYNISLDYITGLSEIPRPIKETGSLNNKITLTEKQKKLLKAYSDNPELQKAVDILLKIGD